MPESVARQFLVKLGSHNMLICSRRYLPRKELRRSGLLLLKDEVHRGPDKDPLMRYGTGSTRLGFRKDLRSGCVEGDFSQDMFCPVTGWDRLDCYS